MLGVTGVLAVGILDSAAGFLLRVDPLYFAPVALAGWRLGRRAGIALALLATLSARTARWLTAPVPEEPLFAAWNTGAQLAGCLAVALLASGLRDEVGRGRALARVDGLTGLPNLAAFRERALLEAERSRRWHRPVALAHLSLRELGTLVDEFGRAVGDEVLRTAAVSLRSSIRSTDLAARIGEDGFALLLPETDATGAGTVVERIVGRLRHDLSRGGWPVTATVGPVTSMETGGVEGADRQVDRFLRAASGPGHRLPSREDAGDGSPAA